MNNCCLLGRQVSDFEGLPLTSIEVPELGEEQYQSADKWQSRRLDDLPTEEGFNLTVFIYMRSPFEQVVVKYGFNVCIFSYLFAFASVISVAKRAYRNVLAPIFIQSNARFKPLTFLIYQKELIDIR